MSADVRAVAALLDRAVHVVFARFRAVALPFLIAALVSNLVQSGAPSRPELLAAAALGAVLSNRAWVVAVVSLRLGRRDPEWRAALRHWRALIYLVFSVLWVLGGYGTLYLFFGFFGLVRIVGGAIVAHDSVPAVGTAWLVAALGVASVVLLAIMFGAFAGTVAFVDTILEGRAPRRAIAAWLRETFRRQTLRRTVFAVLVFLTVGFLAPVLCSYALVWWLPRAALSVVLAVPYGLAIALVSAFILQWRQAVLDERYGRDIEVSLGVHAATTASPSAISPGVTTSQ